MLPTVSLVQERDALTRAVLADEMRRWGNPEIGQEIVGHVHNPTARPYVARILARVPAEVRGHLLAEYRQQAADEGEQAANSRIRESVAGLFEGETLNLSATDEEVRDMAERMVRKVGASLESFRPAPLVAKPGRDAAETEKNRATVDRINGYLRAQTTDMEIRAHLLNICDRIGIDHPEGKSLYGMAARMTDPKWWGKALRRETMCRREEVAISTGLVCSMAGKYLSDASYRRITQKARRDRLFLETWEMVNECGDVVELLEVFEAGQSNPKHRHTEMMVRAKAMEQVADEIGDVGLAITLTCPSRMHARIEKTGARNPKYDGTTPRQAHAHLQGLWKCVRSAMQRRDIEFMYVRVEEPHQDGTPHWHMILFIHPRDERAVMDLFREYYLERFDPDEPGARKHRIEVERIVKAKGGTAHYLSKYVAKNIGGIDAGQQLDLQAEGLEPGNVMPRPAAWARVHGVRQFQFGGTEKVTIYRELRRQREAPVEAVFLPHRQAADAGDYAGFMKAQAAAPLSIWTEERPSGRYPDEAVRVIRGVEIDGKRLQTRVHTWEMRHKAGIPAPWTRTRVNNCTGGGCNGPGNRPEGGGWGGNRHSFHPGVKSGSDHASPDLHK